MKGNRKPSPEIVSVLAQNLRRIRKVRGYTQRELSKLCGFSKTYISNVEQRRVNITLANLEGIAEGLRCSESVLVFRRARADAAGDVRRALRLLNLLCAGSRRVALGKNDTLGTYRCFVAQTAFQVRDLLRKQPTGIWPSDPTGEDLGPVQL